MYCISLIKCHSYYINFDSFTIFHSLHVLRMHRIYNYLETKKRQNSAFISYACIRNIKTNKKIIKN